MPDTYSKLLDHIDVLGATALSFDQKGAALLEFIRALDAGPLREVIAEAGFIPEKFDHDSSEEKLYAKALDCLVAVALERLTFEVEVVRERSNKADVTARDPSADSYGVALDAKGFRLSRSALNPKDYKIEALSGWRDELDFACLIAPLAGFPAGSSRLYAEALKFNVLLLSFSHLDFLLERDHVTPSLLGRLWACSEEVKGVVGVEPNARAYWGAVDQVLCEVVGAKSKEWSDARKRFLSMMMPAIDREIGYYARMRADLATLSKEELLVIATGALKIDERVELMTTKKRKAKELLAELESA